MKNIYQEIIFTLLQTPLHSDADVLSIKRKFCKKYKTKIFSNSELLMIYRKMIKNKKIDKNKSLENILRKRKVRTISGVSVITVLTKPYKCPGKCVYCPSEPGMPKSYLSNEPAAQRALKLKFNPIKQFDLRIKALENNGHQVDKIELLVLGGSFTAYTKEYQKDFITKCFYAANTHKLTPTKIQINANIKKQRAIKSLEVEQKINNKAHYKIIGITLETRPDEISLETIKFFRKLGCTRVQIGVQHIDNKILKLVKRGHLAKSSIQATKLLKENGFKVDYHLMPDLPGSNPQKDLKMVEQIFTNQNFKPDQIKIYPCVVNEFAELFEWYKKGKYKPYSEKQLLNLLLKIKKITPFWVRINRLVRDIPKESIVAGNKITNLRQYLQKELIKQGERCKCIRCREVGLQKNKGLWNKGYTKIKLFIDKYEASDGTEFLISFESTDRKILYGFLRLRFNNSNAQVAFSVLKNSAIIRELHVYGQMTVVGDKIKSNIQHNGLGKKLMFKAEEIVRQNNYKKIAVIAGVGVREYYRKLGYRLKDTYMVKLFFCQDFLIMRVYYGCLLDIFLFFS